MRRTRRKDEGEGGGRRGWRRQVVVCEATVAKIGVGLAARRQIILCRMIALASGTRPRSTP